MSYRPETVPDVGAELSVRKCERVKAMGFSVSVGVGAACACRTKSGESGKDSYVIR